MTRSILFRSSILAAAIAAAACSPPAPAAPAATPQPLAALAPSPVVENPTLSCDAASTLKGDATKESLIATFGAENVTEENVQWVDSETPAIVLFANDPEMRVELLWLDKTSGGPRAIQTGGDKWTGPLGLHPGATMAEVEAANGAPLGLMGFSNHNAGEANDFSGGKLDEGDVGCSVTLAFSMGEDVTGEAMEAVNDDPEKRYRSDSPEMRAAKPFLDTIVLSYFSPS